MNFQDELEKLIIDNAILGVDSGQAYFVDLDQAVTSIINLVDKVIGEDEYPKEHFPTYLGHEDGELAKKFDKVVIRDRLRQEQRAIIRGKDD